jgi:hypothetical protein
MKYILESKAARALDVFVILKDGECVASVLAHHTPSTCTVNIFHRNRRASFQHGVSRECGVYNRLCCALEGLEIDGHEIPNLDRSTGSFERYITSIGYAVIRGI